LQLWRSSVAALLQLQSLTSKVSHSEFLFSFSNILRFSPYRPPAHALSRPMYRSLWTRWNTFWVLPSKETLQATLVMQAGIAHTSMYYHAGQILVTLKCVFGGSETLHMHTHNHSTQARILSCFV
jgi:hypothetical protein